MMSIGFYYCLDDVHKVSCKSVKGNRSYEGGQDTDTQTDRQTQLQIYYIDYLVATFIKHENAE